MPTLGVNIDHIATLRQARRGFEPDPLHAVKIGERAGAHSIVAHLREDRRHIQDDDIRKIRKAVKIPFNLEMSLNAGIVKIALGVDPDTATIVPERRQEITTDGGLDVVRNFSRVKAVTAQLQDKGIIVSLFIAAQKIQIEKAKACGADSIEFHTGTYARAKRRSDIAKELTRLKNMTAFAKGLGLRVAAGHGLNYENTRAVAQIDGIEELNIGHSIISRAVFVGLERAVKEMLKLCRWSPRGLKPAVPFYLPLAGRNPAAFPSPG